MNKSFLLGDDFIISHDHLCCLCIGIVMRKLMLVTLGTHREVDEPITGGGGGLLVGSL